MKPTWRLVSSTLCGAAGVVLAATRCAQTQGRDCMEGKTGERRIQAYDSRIKNTNFLDNVSADKMFQIPVSTNVLVLETDNVLRITAYNSSHA